MAWKIIVLMGFMMSLFLFADLRAVDPVQDKLDHLREYVGFPGCNLAVVYADGSLKSYSSGASDRKSRRSITETDRIFTGSVGKTFVAAVALRLMEQNRLVLSDPIEKYLGQRPWFSRLPNSTRITIDMLMHHSSGIPEHAEEERFTKSLIRLPDKIWQPDELVAFILDHKPLFEAGKGFSYADTNYILLGMIIESLSDKSLYQLVDEWFINPLKLTHTSPAVSRNLANMIQGYTGPEPFGFPNEVVQNGRYVTNPQVEWTGGGFITTAVDLACWGHHIYHGNLLKPKTKARMLQTIRMDDGHASAIRYGLGVMVWETEHGPAYGHGGFFPGYQSVVKYYKKYGITLAMQFNEDRTVNPEMKKAYDFPDLFIESVRQK